METRPTPPSLSTADRSAAWLGREPMPAPAPDAVEVAAESDLRALERYAYRRIERGVR